MIILYKIIILFFSKQLNSVPCLSVVEHELILSVLIMALLCLTKTLNLINNIRVDTGAWSSSSHWDEDAEILNNV